MAKAENTTDSKVGKARAALKEACKISDRSDRTAAVQAAKLKLNEAQAGGK